jgi:hypothetical protein
MRCHECAVTGDERAAVGLCRFCLVGLCKAHLVEAARSTAGAPQYAYTCHHDPGSAGRRHHERTAGAVSPLQHALRVGQQWSGRS